MTPEDRKAITAKVFPEEGFEEKYAEIEECIDALPLVNLTMTASVRGEDNICVGDLLTCKLTVEYKNLEKGKKSGYVHSKRYPYLKRDNWYLIITDA